MGVVVGAGVVGPFWRAKDSIWRACLAFSSQAARAAGSIGQVEGEGSSAVLPIPVQSSGKFGIEVVEKANCLASHSQGSSAVDLRAADFLSTALINP